MICDMRSRSSWSMRFKFVTGPCDTWVQNMDFHSSHSNDLTFDAACDHLIFGNLYRVSCKSDATIHMT